MQTRSAEAAAIARFAAGEFSVMAATSIGEEGLDIPAVDNVVFFEPIPSEIRSIQRRGRAGRLQAGKVFVLITTGTRDEAYFYSSRKKEETMKRIVGRMQRDFSHTKNPPPPMGGKKEPMAKKRGKLQQSKITDY